MAKNVVQDVVPGKRSIRDISLPSRRQSPSSSSRNINGVKPPERDEEKEKDVDTEENFPKGMERGGGPKDYEFDYDLDRPKKDKRLGLWALIIVFVLALGFGILSLFASAKVTVVAKTQTVPLQGTFIASKDQPAGQFGYQIVSVSKTAQKQVTAGAEAQSDTKASGTITIFNKTDTVQNLVATTRFQTSAGLVYRISKPVSVPKATTVSGTLTPGSASAVVTADKSGATYNIGLSDFTLPGLAGTAKANDIFARSTTPMTGGFSGMKKTVDAATQTAAQNDLQNVLKTDLANQIGAQLPQDFVLYQSSISYQFGTITQASDSPSGQATLVLTGTASAVIFDKMLLSQKIMASLASSTDIVGQAVVQNVGDLKFTLMTPTAITKEYTGPISFNLVGDGHVLWLFDQAALKADIVGINKSNLNALLQAKYPAILKAQATIFPVWKQSFPGDPAKITISQVDNF